MVKIFDDDQLTKADIGCVCGKGKEHGTLRIIM